MFRIGKPDGLGYELRGRQRQDAARACRRIAFGAAARSQSTVALTRQCPPNCQRGFFAFSSFQVLPFPPKMPTIALSVASTLSGARQKYNARVSSQFCALPALFCQRAKINSFVFMHQRTLSEKRGVRSKLVPNLYSPRDGVSKMFTICAALRQNENRIWTTFATAPLSAAFRNDARGDAIIPAST